MPTTIRTYSKEISVKGKCYLVCEEYDADDFASVLNELVQFCRARGASFISLAAKNASGLVLCDGQTFANYRFSYDTDFDVYEKQLLKTEGQPLRIKRLTASNAPLYQAIFNETFFEVPNSETLDDVGLKELLASPQREAGFFMIGGEPIGIFELNYAEEPAEIAAISLRKDYHGSGLATKALLALENELMRKGHARVQLLAASKNERAIAFYQKCGFVKSRHLSTWFRIEEIE